LQHFCLDLQHRADDNSQRLNRFTTLHHGRQALPHLIYEETSVKKTILGALVVLMFVAVGIAAAPPLTFTFSDVHANKTATETDTFAVNNAGMIAGDYVDAKGIQHAMILAGKKLTAVDHKNCTNTGGFSAGAIAFYGINKTGAAAGWCTSTKTGLFTGFVYDAGKFTAINFPKSNGTQAIGINDNGDVVGMYLDSTSTQHAFLKKGTKYTSFDVKNDTISTAWGINNKGQIALFALNSSNSYESFLYNGKTFKKIGDPNAGPSGTIVRIVNNKGDTAGAYFDSNGSEVGFLNHGGTYYDLKDPKANNNTRPDGLNDKLVIVGRYTPADGSNVGFKAITKTSAGVFAPTIDLGNQSSGDQRSSSKQPSNTP
jgi:probable HAF family extracellular repeat protein